MHVLMQVESFLRESRPGTTTTVTTLGASCAERVRGQAVGRCGAVAILALHTPLPPPLAAGEIVQAMGLHRLRSASTSDNLPCCGADIVNLLVVSCGVV
jgi:hypothetical protein